MKTIIEMIGAFVLATIMIAIPILCGLSFVLDWYAGVKFFLIVGTALILLGIWNYVLELSSKEGR